MRPIILILVLSAIAWAQTSTTVQNITVKGSVKGTGPIAGQWLCGQGLSASVVANSIGITCPSSITGYQLVFPGAAGSGFLNWTNASNVVTATWVGFPPACDPASGNALKVSGTTFSCVVLVPVFNFIPIIYGASQSGIEFDVPNGTGQYRILNQGASGSFAISTWNGASWASVIAYSPDFLSLDARDSGGTIRLGQNSGALVEVFPQMNSLLADGTAPFPVTSKTMNANLNADMVDGFHADSASTGKAMCWKDATHMGYCSTVVAADGTCTCN